MISRIVLGTGFKKCVKGLKKKFPRISQDLKSAIHAIQEYPNLGVVIPKSSGIRKLRVKNSSAGRGKSGGFRLIYYHASLPEPTLYLLFLYSKTEHSNVTPAVLVKFLQEIILDDENHSRKNM